jgi:hypothetical protein
MPVRAKPDLFPVYMTRAKRSASVKVFGCRPMTTGRHTLRAGVGKPPREETAMGKMRRCRARYGDLRAADEASEVRRGA